MILSLGTWFIFYMVVVFIGGSVQISLTNCDKLIFSEILCIVLLSTFCIIGDVKKNIKMFFFS